MTSIPRPLLRIGGLLLAIGYAFGGAGILALAAHPPGTPARAELTWAGDERLRPGLNAAASDLAHIAAETDELGVLARGALALVATADASTLATTIEQGTADAASIGRASITLRQTLESMPGDAPTDTLLHSQATLERRAAILRALELTGHLDTDWARLRSGALVALRLVDLLQAHDAQVAVAAAAGRDQKYLEAIGAIRSATSILDAATLLRDQIANAADVTTLDEWLRRNHRYDVALTGLYKALLASLGQVTEDVRSAYREEKAARAELPPDTRALVVIIADVARGGLNQAVIAIEQARGQLSLALGAIGGASSSG